MPSLSVPRVSRYNGRVNDALPPLPSNAPYHPAPPPEGWQPLSGLAVTAFVLSLVFILLAVLGFWIAQMLPLALGIFTLASVRAGQRRGRVLAVWGIVIALGAGSCSYAMHAKVREMFGGMAESVLAALSSNGTDAEIEDALDDWFRPADLTADPELIARIRGRYRELVGAVGPYRNEIELGTAYLGSLPIFWPPKDVEEVGTAGKGAVNLPGAAVWVDARFAHESVHVAIVLLDKAQQDLEALAALGPGAGAAPLVADVRFFRARGRRAIR